MADIQGSFPMDGTQEIKKTKNYKHKYKSAKKKQQQQKDQISKLQRKLKDEKHHHKDRDKIQRLKGEVDAYKKILKKCQIIANPLALPESVIEIQGEVRDD